MRYLSLDLETTGLNPELCQVLEIGAVVDDFSWPEETTRPTFNCYVVHPMVYGEHYALNMNAKIIERIAKKEEGFNYLSPSQAILQLQEFVNKYFGDRRFTVAGKNVGTFDKPFLHNMGAKDITKRFMHRMMDPAILYFQPQDETLPALDKCLERAGYTEQVTHNAVDDAMQVIKALRQKLVPRRSVA